MWPKSGAAMNKFLEKLLDGGKVEWVALGEIAEVKHGKDWKKLQAGNIPVYGSGGIMGYVDKSAYDRPSVLIPRKGSITNIFYVEEPFWNVDTIFYLEIDTNVIVPKYLYYFLTTIDFLAIDTGSGRPSLTKEIISKILIPSPCPDDPAKSKRIQTEIVRILDEFAQLTAQLTAEYNMRKLQYQYYRDELLQFGNDVKLIPLKNLIIHSSSGSTPNKANPKFYENGTVPWIRTQDVNFHEISAVESYITDYAVEKTSAKWIPENCVIVAISGASAGRCAFNKFKATTNQHCLNMEIDPKKALYKYVFYCVCNNYLELQSKKQGARGDLNSSLILDTEIPIPPLSEQSRIVSILDKFDTLANSITEGLPREIELRKKQYEYYRDLLFDFPGAPGK